MRYVWGTLIELPWKKGINKIFMMLSQQIISGKLLLVQIQPTIEITFLLTNNNMLLKICCESVVKKFWT